MNGILNAQLLGQSNMQKIFETAHTIMKKGRKESCLFALLHMIIAVVVAEVVAVGAERARYHRSHHREW